MRFQTVSAFMVLLGTSYGPAVGPRRDPAHEAQVNESNYRSICPIEDTVAGFCQVDQPGRVASRFADASERPEALNCERRPKIVIGIRQRQASIARGDPLAREKRLDVCVGCPDNLSQRLELRVQVYAPASANHVRG